MSTNADLNILDFSGLRYYDGKIKDYVATDAEITATGSTTGRTLPERFADVVNVKDFGAKGDGVTDDTAAINAAIFAASNSTSTVIMPRGIYVISGSILMRSNVRLHGLGAIIVNVSGDYHAYWALKCEDCNDWIVDGLFFDDTRGGILVLGANNFTLSNIRIRTIGCWNTYIANVKNFYIHDINFINDHGPNSEGYLLQTDGIHLIGPARTGFIERIFGTNNDDMFCFQPAKNALYDASMNPEGYKTNEYALYYPASDGDIVDIYVSEVKTSTYGATIKPDAGFDDSTHSFFAFNCRAGYKLDKIYIDNVYGDYSGTSIVNFSGKYLTTYGSDIGHVKFSNFNIWRQKTNVNTSVYGFCPIMIESPEIDCIEFENWNLYLPAMPASSVIRVHKDNNPVVEHDSYPIHVGKIVLHNFNCIQTTAIDAPSFPETYFLRVAGETNSAVSVDSVEMKNIDFSGKALKMFFSVARATVSNIVADGLKLAIDNTGLSQDSMCFNFDSNSVVKNLSIDNFSYKPVIDSGHSGSVINIGCSAEYIDMENVYTKCSEKRVIILKDSSSTTVEFLSLKDSYLYGVAYPLFLSGTTKCLCVENTSIFNYANTVYANASTVINLMMLANTFVENGGIPVVISNSAQLGRVISSVPYSGPQPSTPKTGDRWMIGSDSYVYDGSNVCTYDKTAV